MEGIILKRISYVPEPGMNELNISLAEIPQGMFMLRITSDRNNKVIKFIKQ